MPLSNLLTRCAQLQIQVSEKLFPCYFVPSVPPKILPINPMTDLLREGMRAAITCVIMEGDLPITFRWERNGKPVSNNVVLGTVVRRIDEFSSSLIIEQVSSTHSGNYTCIASNVAGAERYGVPLTVNGSYSHRQSIHTRLFIIVIFLSTATLDSGAGGFKCCRRARSNIKLPSCWISHTCHNMETGCW